MEASCISNTNFNGNIIVSNNLSKKPKQNIDRIKDVMQVLVKDKNYKSLRDSLLDEVDNFLKARGV